jgi:hypothetical protein
MKKQIELRKNELKWIPWKDLKEYDFNSLKDSTDRDISKLKNSIVNSKFSFPFYIWNRYVIDGAGRKQALIELESEGYKIPDLPVLAVDARDLNEAKKLVLAISSQHGKVSKQSYDDFTIDILDLNIEEINIEIEDYDVSSEDDKVLEAKEDDFDITPPEEPFTVLGDLYEIGEHRLLCGDSTDSDQVERLFTKYIVKKEYE